ncbi:hypothetical protein BY458DRAFT_552385 [Sporodiniella umbellata]|nr:hypothetical protein BY458DRAFT_552385 [Sporodiniella umbellata]
MAKKPKKDYKKESKKERQKKKKHLISDDNGDLNQQLRDLGLQTKDIAGDGNCLFRSLADQYFGHDNQHMVIRQKVCDYLEENEETYQFFVEDDLSFEDYLKNMRCDGTYGGNMVLVAFAKSYEVDIKVYQPGLIYVIEANDNQTSDRTMHIAYHDWEHYSSIRNRDGPFEGLPEINVVSREKEEEETMEEEAYDSKEKAVLNACPDAGIRQIRRLLRKYKGDTNKVIDDLYESQDLSIDNDGPAIESNTNNLTDTVGQEQVPIARSVEPETAKGDLIGEKEDEEPIQLKTTETCRKRETINPKRISASDRKKEAKRKQKEAKLVRAQARAANRATANKSEVEHTAQLMKEMYI